MYKFENRSTEIIQPDKQGGKKKIRRNKQSLKDLWDKNKKSKICVIEVLEGEVKEHSTKIFFLKKSGPQLPLLEDRK